MSPIREQLVDMIDCLPEDARRFLPDDVATPDDLDAIREARAEYTSGRTIPHEVVNWD